MRGGVSGQYTAMAHFRMSDSLTGGETRTEPQTPLRSNISGVTRVWSSGSVVVMVPLHKRSTASEPAHSSTSGRAPPARGRVDRNYRQRHADATARRRRRRRLLVADAVPGLVVAPRRRRHRALDPLAPGPGV